MAGFCGMPRPMLATCLLWPGDRGWFCAMELPVGGPTVGELNRGTLEAGFNEALRRCVLVDVTRDGSVVSTWGLWPLVMLK